LNYLLQYTETENDESKFLKYKTELYSSVNKISQTSKKGREIYYMFHQSMSNLFLSRNELDSAFYHSQMAEKHAIELNDDFLYEINIDLNKSYDYLKIMKMFKNLKDYEISRARFI